jgi:polysaccharide biosynthesis protein PslG
MFGLSTGGAIQNEDATTLGRDLDSIAGTHTRWVRVDINWAQIQGGGSSSYNWASVDRVVQGATARGIKVLAGILYTPSWARPSGTSATYGPDPTQYATFAATAVRHYAAMGVHSYEVWNEPNTTAFWTSKPDPAAYTRLLKAAYPAIKGADSTATVLTGGTAPAPSDGTQISPVDFLKGIYANGGGGSFDAVAHHPYCWPANPGDAQGWSAWYQMYGTSPSLRSVMTDNGDSAKKIWATEFGAPTNGPAGTYVSEADQASMLTKAYQLYRSYDWAGPLFFYQGRDQSATDTSTRENFFGLTHNDFTAKPAYTAYQQATVS